MKKDNIEKVPKFVCIECLHPADEIFTPFVNKKDIRMRHCKKCDKLVDKYLEYDVPITMIDMLLLDTCVWRHVLHNIQLRFVPYRVALICMFCDGYMSWVTSTNADANSGDVFEAVKQVELYVQSMYAGLQLIFTNMLLITCVILTHHLPICETKISIKRICIKTTQALLIANSAKLFYIPALVWSLNDDCKFYLRMVELYQNLCVSTAISTTFNSHFLLSLVSVTLCQTLSSNLMFYVINSEMF